MSKLEELIKEFCPNGVEYKKLGELGQFYGGLSGKSKNDFTDGNEKFITYKNVYSNPALDLDIEDRVKINKGEKQNSLQYGDIIFTGSSETPDECGFSSVITKETNEKLYLNSFCFFFRMDDPSLLLPDFAKHLFRADSIRYQIGKTASGVTRYNVSKEKMKQVQIPLPALPVQREIVRVLDGFTLYSAELTAELTARRKQYEFYRDKLLTFEKTEVKQMPLGKLAKFTYGYTDVAKDVGDARFIRITDINEDGCLSSGNCKYITLNDESKKYLLKEGDLLLARTGATYGKTLYFPNNEPAVYASFLIKIDLDNSVILNRYYWHFSKSNLYWKQADKYVSKAGQQQFNTNAVSRVIVPVPSIEVQERIVKVLDNFDEICSDLKIGLPAEIEARQKQYEYYRDKLLNFKDIEEDGEKETKAKGTGKN